MKQPYIYISLVSLLFTGGWGSYSHNLRQILREPPNLDGWSINPSLTYHPPQKEGLIKGLLTIAFPQ